MNKKESKLKQLLSTVYTYPVSSSEMLKDKKDLTETSQSSERKAMEQSGPEEVN